MGTKALLHRNKIEEFKEWLEINNHFVLPIRGNYELLRWKGEPGKAMPIVFNRNTGDHLSVNESAVPYVHSFIRSQKQCLKKWKNTWN